MQQLAGVWEKEMWMRENIDSLHVSQASILMRQQQEAALRLILWVSALAGPYRIAVSLLPGPSVCGPTCHIECSVSVSIQYLDGIVRRRIEKYTVL